MLLLTDVAVVATIAEVVPGFERASPSLLYVLNDVAPLRSGSLVPAYLVMPVAQYVINGQVFCGDPQFNRLFPAFEAGDRIVLVGRWRRRVVWVGPALTWDLATVEVKTGHLEWHGQQEGWPATLALLKERVDAASRGGLFELAAPLLLEDSHSVNRRDFSETWWKYHQGGCTVTSVDERQDGLWDVLQTCGADVRRRQIRVSGARDQ